MLGNIYPRIIAIIIIIPGMVLSACGLGDGNENISNISATGYTYHQASGNRYVLGQGNVDQIEPIDIEFSDTVKWVVGLANDLASVWGIVLENGDVYAYEVHHGVATPKTITPNKAGREILPTMVMATNDKLWLLNDLQNGSDFSGPVTIDKESGSRVFVAKNGDLVMKTNGQEHRLPIDVVRYSRIVKDEKNRLLVLTKPTSIYDHRVLGVSHPNASEIAIIETSPQFKVVASISLESGEVIEGNPLIWEDVNDDGIREIIVTLSDAVNGAKIVIFNEDGTRYGTNEAIGQGFRWRHQIAVAPFKSDEKFLASVYIPHLWPNLEFITLNGPELQTEKQAISYSSHLRISLNLDHSLVGDFDDDGKVEVLLIDRSSEDNLAAFEYTNEGIDQNWQLDTGGVISSNLAAITLANNSIALAVGHGKNLRIWHPQQ